MTKPIPLYGTSASPLFGQAEDLFHTWLQWLRELGGSYTPMRDLDEKRPYTGRRDPDRKPRRYPLNDKKYGMDPKTGTIWRRPEWPTQ